MNKAINKIFSLNSMRAFSNYKFLKSCEIFFDILWATSPLSSMGKWLFQKFLKIQTVVFEKCNVETSSNDLCLLRCLFNVKWHRIDKHMFIRRGRIFFSCKHGNTMKSMEFSKATIKSTSYMY